MDYAKNIVDLLTKQREKGLEKYGETLEENTTLSRVQRIEHLEEELIDALMYAEHIKAVAQDGLTANDYQRMAMRTASGVDRVGNGRLLNGVMGLNGEAGECIDIMKKHLFQGHELDREHLIEELGDCAWYLAVSCEALGVSLGECMQRNIDKLATRYPEGFDKARSINRSAEKTYTLEEVKAELGIELETEEPKRKTFLEDFLSSQPTLYKPDEVYEEFCVIRRYPQIDDNFVCPGEGCCEECWNRPMPESTSESGED